MKSDKEGLEYKLLDEECTIPDVTDNAIIVLKTPGKESMGLWTFLLLRPRPRTKQEKA